MKSKPFYVVSKTFQTIKHDDIYVGNSLYEMRERTQTKTVDIAYFANKKDADDYAWIVLNNEDTPQLVSVDVREENLIVEF